MMAEFLELLLEEFVRSWSGNGVLCDVELVGSL